MGEAQRGRGAVWKLGAGLVLGRTRLEGLSGALCEQHGPCLMQTDSLII